MYDYWQDQPDKNDFVPCSAHLNFEKTTDQRDKPNILQFSAD